MGKTLVIGASPNPLRYAHKAVRRLLEYEEEVVAIGKRETEIEGVQVHTGQPAFDDIHTIAMYIGPERQEEYLDYILSLEPKRIIFNPGTYNRKLEDLAEKAGIEVVEDCTLLMLSGGDY